MEGDDTGMPALMYAANAGHSQVVQLLLDAGAQVDARDNAGYTSLMIAAGSGHAQLVELLLHAGAKGMLVTTSLRAIYRADDCGRQRSMRKSSRCSWTPALRRMLVTMLAR